MGMYPGATLCYGIEIPEDIDWDELPWMEGCEGDVEWGLEKELERLGISSVSVAYYGNFAYSDRSGSILCTRSFRFYAYDPEELTPEDLSVDSSDVQALGQAWAALFPGVEVTDPKWLISLSYG